MDLKAALDGLELLLSSAQKLTPVIAAVGAPQVAAILDVAEKVAENIVNTMQIMRDAASTDDQAKLEGMLATLTDYRHQLTAQLEAS